MARGPATILEAGLRAAAAAAGAIFPVRPGLHARTAPRIGWLVDATGLPHRIGAGAQVGRDDQVADLVIDHDSVSRRHAELDFDASTDRWSLADLGSTNGTFVDGRRIGPRTALRDGALVVLGDVPLVFLRDAPAPRTDAPLHLAGTDDRGTAELANRRVTLEGSAWRLAHALGARWLAEAHLPHDARGFVRVTELVLLRPGRDETLVAVVRLAARRLTRDLATIDAAALLDVSERLGYRLRISTLSI